MLAQQLKERIEGWAQDLRQRSELLELARRGQMPPEALGLYLSSLRYLFAHSQRNLITAGQRSAAKGRAELSACLLRKAAQEAGHDAWAEADIKRLPPSAVGHLEPAAGVVELVRLQRRLIEDDPFTFLAYSLWAEYFTVLLGDEWVEALVGSGYSPSQLTAVTKHVEADRAHAADGFADLERYADARTDPTAVLAAIGEAEAAFEAFCEQVHAFAIAPQARRAG